LSFYRPGNMTTLLFYVIGHPYFQWIEAVLNP
jgi:hypothetical protein